MSLSVNRLKSVRSSRMLQLPLDRGQVDFVNDLTVSGQEFTLTLWIQYMECLQCPFLVNATIPFGGNVSRLFNANYRVQYRIGSSSQRQAIPTVICQGIINLLDQTVLLMRISNREYNSTVGQCQLETIQKGRDNLWPLLAVWFAVFLGTVTFYLGRYFIRRWRDTTTTVTLTPSSCQNHLGPALAGCSTEPIKPPESLIALRGLSALTMIFINWGAGHYSSLHYSEWDGLRLGDLILPYFVFILGMGFAFSSLEAVRARPGQSLFKLLLRTNFKSALSLFLFGIVLNSHDNADYRFIRIPGVFQKFSMCHLLLGSVHTVTVYRMAASRQSPTKAPSAESFTGRHMADILPYWRDWLMAIAMGLIYIFVSFVWDYDSNCPRGYLGPGGLYRNASYPDCVGGAANRLDRLVFGERHISKTFSAADLYDPQGEYQLKHDPEGLLGTCTSVVLGFVGLQAGKILHCYQSSAHRMSRLAVWSVSLALLALWLSVSELIPINRNLWSLSYICASGSICLLSISVFHLLIDHWRVWPRGTPLHCPGTNSFLLFIGHLYTVHTMPFFFNYDTSSHLWPLLQNVVGMLIWHAISVYLLYNKFIFRL